ncbi:hypothetical protein DYB30_009604 [Aphanomyces astaci]|uniref:Uncharacterized protein n=1 Tax=Aphanomyces astaci TaxID=112090 RepID=A0A397CX56_APHAT|nr:hypothetical protein DYB30_009604 [Aphanomyces astaci]
MHWSRSQVVHQGPDACISGPRCDTKKLRRHIDDAVLRPSSEPPLPPPVLDDVAPKLIDPIMEYLAEHRSAKFLEARAAKAALEHLLKSEHADVERSIALVYASLSEAWLRGKFCSEEQKFASAVDVYTKFHGFKFERYCSLDGSLATFDKLRKAVEKRESTTLSDSHLASVLLSALPDCIAHDVQVWRGARPSIPYTQLRELLPQHWHELTQKYPDFLGPKPTAHAPMAVKTEAATPTAAAPNVVTITAVIPTAATPKAANKESRLRTDAINVTKVRFATTAIATTRAIGPMISSMMIIIVWLLQSCTPSKMTGEAAVAAPTKVAPVKIPEETTIVVVA